MSWSLRLRHRLGTLSLDVELQGEGRPVALVGPNGSGKTTILRAMVGALTPDEGVFTLGDRTLFDGTHAVPIQQRRLGYLPQGLGLFPHLTTRQNIAYGGSDAVQRWIDQLDLGDLADHHPAALSGGEQQRVALARALAHDPAMLLLDEPLSSVDIVTRTTLRARLGDLLTGRPCLLVTHDCRDVIALDAVVHVLEGGRIVQRGSLEALRAAPATPFVRAWSDPLT